MTEVQTEEKDERATVEFWRAKPHNCTDKEAQVQISKFLSEHEKQNP